MRESTIERYLVRRVREAGGEARKVEWPGRRGAPDRMVLMPDGVLVFVELKAPGKVPGKVQQREIARLESMGQVVWVIDCVEDVDVLTTVLETARGSWRWR